MRVAKVFKMFLSYNRYKEIATNQETDGHKNGVYVPILTMQYFINGICHHFT